MTDLILLETIHIYKNNYLFFDNFVGDRLWLEPNFTNGKIPN
jgi:hypothetical protein